MSAVRCAQCKRRLIEKAGDGVGSVIRANGKITIDDQGICRAQCFFCRAPVVLPLELTKSEATAPQARFVIPK